MVIRKLKRGVRKLTAKIKFTVSYYNPNAPNIASNLFLFDIKGGKTLNTYLTAHYAAFGTCCGLKVVNLTTTLKVPPVRLVDLTIEELKKNLATYGAVIISFTGPNADVFKGLFKADERCISEGDLVFLPITKYTKAAEEKGNQS